MWLFSLSIIDSRGHDTRPQILMTTERGSFWYGGSCWSEQMAELLKPSTKTNRGHSGLEGNVSAPHLQGSWIYSWAQSMVFHVPYVLPMSVRVSFRFSAFLPPRTFVGPDTPKSWGHLSMLSFIWNPNKCSGKWKAFTRRTSRNGHAGLVSI